MRPCEGHAKEFGLPLEAGRMRVFRKGAGWQYGQGHCHIIPSPATSRDSARRTRRQRQPAGRPQRGALRRNFLVYDQAVSLPGLCLPGP